MVQRQLPYTFSAQDNSNAQGTYRVVVTGNSGTISHNTVVIVNVSYSFCVGGGGGGSVARGSLVTLADGGKVSVQNVQLSTNVMIYNVLTVYRTDFSVHQNYTIVLNNAPRKYTTTK